MRRSVSGALLGGAAAFLAFDIGRRLFRRSQLFAPERAPLISWDPADYGVAPESVEEVAIEARNGARMHGWYCRAPKPAASALYCHGNAGNLTTVAHVMPFLQRAGLNVLLFDYRGYGRSEGAPSLSGVVSDALAAARHHDMLRPPELPSIVYGYSLGGAVAAQLVGRHPFDGVILQSTFTNLPDIARVAFPRLPIRLLTGRIFDTLSVVQRLDLPALIIHGSADETCPTWMGQRLHESCASRSKRMVLIKGGMHGDLFQRGDAESLVDAIREFIAVIGSASCSLS